MKVKDLLAKPDAWHKGHMAVDAEGLPVGTEDEEACGWCLLGAVYRCYPMGERARVFDRLLTAIFARCGAFRITSFNDDPKTTHADLMAVLEEADI